MNKVIAAVLMLVCVIAVAQQQPNVSIIALIATPERYDGKQIAVSGFMFLQRERNALYVGKADFQHALFKNVEEHWTRWCVQPVRMGVIRAVAGAV